MEDSYVHINHVGKHVRVFSVYVRHFIDVFETYKRVRKPL